MSQPRRDRGIDVGLPPDWRHWVDLLKPATATVLPTQKPGRQLTGAEVLMLGVLQQAIFDLSDRHGPTRRAAQNFLLLSPATPRDERFFTFEGICDHFGWSAAAIRARIDHLRRIRRASGVSSLKSGKVRLRDDDAAPARSAA